MKKVASRPYALANAPGNEHRTKGEQDQVLGKIMVDDFEDWILSHAKYLESKGVSTDFSRREEPTVAATVTLESKSIVADITLWDIGACDVDMLSYETGESIFSKRYDFTSFSEIVPALEEVCNRMTAPHNEA